MDVSVVTSYKNRKNRDKIQYANTGGGHHIWWDVPGCFFLLWKSTQAPSIHKMTGLVVTNKQIWTDPSPQNSAAIKTICYFGQKAGLPSLLWPYWALYFSPIHSNVREPFFFRSIVFCLQVLSIANLKMYVALKVHYTYNRHSFKHQTHKQSLVSVETKGAVVSLKNKWRSNECQVL